LIYEVNSLNHEMILVNELSVIWLDFFFCGITSSIYVVIVCMVTDTANHDWVATIILIGRFIANFFGIRAGIKPNLGENMPVSQTSWRIVWNNIFVVNDSDCLRELWMEIVTKFCVSHSRRTECINDINFDALIVHVQSSNRSHSSSQGMSCYYNLGLRVFAYQII
jgi:hypothetical protein